MVVACIALVVALGGTGYAAITLPRNSVGQRAAEGERGDRREGPRRLARGEGLRRLAAARAARAAGPAGPTSSGGGAAGARGFASRDPVSAAGAIDRRRDADVDVVALGVPAGTGGYVASSGPVTVTGPSRLIAQRAGRHPQRAPRQRGNVDVPARARSGRACVRSAPTSTRTSAPAAAYLPVAVSAGSDVEAGHATTCASQCSGDATLTFHRGNLTVAVAPR